jgi:uncharacterized protein YndB with AHSA1/START domain
VGIASGHEFTGVVQRQAKRMLLVSEIAPEFETQELVCHRNDSATKGARPVAQQEYEQSQVIDASPEEVFAWLSDVDNLPKYLPPVVVSSVDGPPTEGVPGQRIRTTLEYPGEGGSTFDAVGYLAVDEEECSTEWGAEAGRDYLGWLTVGNHGEGGSEVVVHLSFGERSAAPAIEERSREGRDPLAEGISATLESIRRQIEEGSGKLQAPPPPEGSEPQLDENPAVVDQDLPSDPRQD